MVAAGGMIAWSLAGWRNMPRLPQPQASAAGVMIGLALLAAYWVGTRTNRSKAVAAAVARAEAAAVAAATGGSADSSASAQVVVINTPAAGAAATGRAALNLEDAPWMVGAHRTVELDEREALEVAWEDVREEREAQR